MSISRIHQTFRPFLVSSLPGYEYQCQRLCHSSQRCSPRQQRPSSDLHAGPGNSFSDGDPVKVFNYWEQMKNSVLLGSHLIVEVTVKIYNY